jgi:hypothetical protein
VSRKLNKIQLVPDAACVHCGEKFERPYDRQPELEGNSGTRVVLKCQHCNCCTAFNSVERKVNQ